MQHFDQILNIVETQTHPLNKINFLFVLVIEYIFVFCRKKMSIYIHILYLIFNFHKLKKNTKFVYDYFNMYYT